MFLVVLASALLGILGVVVAFRARLARRAANVRRDLGAPQRFDPDAKSGTKVCLEGRIVGSRVTSWSGLPAETAPSALALEVDGTILPIRGRAAVLAGSRETVPLRGRALRTLVPRDRVRVRATIIRDGDPLAGYRDGRSAMALESFDERGIVELAYAGGPRPSRLGISRYAFGTFAGAMTGVIASLGALYTHRPPPVTVVRDIPVAPKPGPAECTGDVYFTRGNLEAFTNPDDESTLFGKCALRRAEASLVLHQWKKASAAVRAFAASSGGSPQDLERRDALECIARAIDHDGTLYTGSLGFGRAMCRPLEADTLDYPNRIARLGDVSWVWNDTQGMEFAKGPVARMSHALLLEAGQPETDAGRYGFYPDAYLARNDPGATAPYSWNHFEGGADVLRLAWETKRNLDGLPFALFAAMSAKGRPGAREPADLRMYVHGNLGMFLAATGDIEGARGELATIADIPDDGASHHPYWTRPTVRAVQEAIDDLASGASPFRMHGEIWSVLETNLALARRTDGDAALAVRRLRAVILDREIAVPLYFLEAFARR